MLVYSSANDVSAFIMRCGHVLKWFSHYYILCCKTSQDQGSSNFPTPLNLTDFSCFTKLTINSHSLAPFLTDFLMKLSERQC